MSSAYVFPGQGSQAVGMGKALAETFPVARRVFDEVDAALGDKLTTVMWEGPAETLTLTENAQPALVAVSLAAMRVLETGSRRRSQARREIRGRPFGRRIFGAGRGRFAVDRRCGAARSHSRPRHAAGGSGRHGRDGGVARASISSRRRRLPPRPRRVNWCRPPTTMAAGRSWCPATRRRSSARSRSPRPRVSGAPCCCRCPRRSIRALMQPAAEVMAEALGKVTIKPPVVPLVANVLAAPVTDPAQIVRGLVEQVTGTVRWRESVAFMAAAGVTHFYEVGSGKVLCGLVKRIADGASGRVDRHARRCRGLQDRARLTTGISYARKESAYVRSDRQDRAGDRSDRRHRRRDRARAAPARRDGRALRHAARMRSTRSPAN